MRPETTMLLETMALLYAAHVAYAPYLFLCWLVWVLLSLSYEKRIQALAHLIVTALIVCLPNLLAFLLKA